jgi:sulfide:quinone oxidoreductase
MKTRVLVLGAGFGGLELSTLLSEEFGSRADVTVIDKSDAFVFGFSKLHVMFGHEALDAVRMPYRNFVKPGVRFRQETITSIDAERRRVTTDAGSYEADVLVVALGADYDMDATPGLAEGGNEFYTVAGAQRLRGVLPEFSKGHAIIGVAAAPYKCPPAPSECALLLHDFLTQGGVRSARSRWCCRWAAPCRPRPKPRKRWSPPSSNTTSSSCRTTAWHRWTPADGWRCSTTAANCHMSCSWGVPKHRAPNVLLESGIVENGWVTVNPRTLETKYPGVYAVGDIANTGTPKAGVFAEGAARAVATTLIARARGGNESGAYNGAGTCYIEFGGGQIGRVDVDFFSGPKPTGTYHEPSLELRADKMLFGSSRRARWFGL